MHTCSVSGEHGHGQPDGSARPDVIQSKESSARWSSCQRWRSTLSCSVHGNKLRREIRPQSGRMLDSPLTKLAGKSHAREIGDTGKHTQRRRPRDETGWRGGDSHSAEGGDVWEKRWASSDESDESIDGMDGSGFEREGQRGFCEYDESSCITMAPSRDTLRT
ncbi:expressed unknown protein [Ectocarpus siliculosus]|uniref:Uncharacterized protein n=1 Tax=Ectocarpus siliculosus TaxID=2880 RepID=D7G1D0_ECTSI|nr:expressed unknown protein [Ectocarpus siliculosus]|eukprot:CBJ33240.1 expressed unknown protein [Ectocarpus siliculosus]